MTLRFVSAISGVGSNRHIAAEIVFFSPTLWNNVVVIEITAARNEHIIRSKHLGGRVD